MSNLLLVVLQEIIMDANCLFTNTFRSRLIARDPSQLRSRLCVTKRNKLVSEGVGTA